MFADSLHPHLGGLLGEAAVGVVVGWDLGEVVVHGD